MADVPGNAAKSRKRRCVRFRQNTDDDNQIVGVVESSDQAVRRSGLPSGMENTEDLYSLPGNLSPEDLRLWKAAHLAQSAIPPEEMATVLKVRH